MNSPAVTARPEEVFGVVAGKAEGGKSVFSVLVKRTYDVRPGKTATRAELTGPLREADVYYEPGDAETCSIKYENDQAPYKLATDVVLVGKAYAPGGRPVAWLDAALEVAGVRKVVRVIGNRACRYRAPLPPAFTDPEPFTEMEVRYERAYGGKDVRSVPDLEFYYPRNTLGTGMALTNVREVIDGLPLPNLEDPADLLTPERVVLGDPERWNRQPLPQGFGWFHKIWYPRRSFVASFPAFVNLDEPMREEALGLVPKRQMILARQGKLPSFDVRFNNGASPGLALPYLRGGEPVRLTNLTPDGDLSFRLPEDAPRITLDIGMGERELAPVLHTVCVRPDDGQLDLVWCGAHEYPGPDWLPRMKCLEAKVS